MYNPLYLELKAMEWTVQSEIKTHQKVGLLEVDLLHRQSNIKD
jgi:hypothetical protein